jgi:hypothetical protein
VEEEAREAHGISGRTLERARQALKVSASVEVRPPARRGAPPRRVWTLALPTAELCQGCDECRAKEDGERERPASASPDERPRPARRRR